MHAFACGTRHAPNRGKDIEGGVCRPCRTCAIHMPLLPAQSIRLARERDCTAEFVSLLLFFVVLDLPSTGAGGGRYER